MDGREGDEERVSTGEIPRRALENRAPLQHVTIGRVMPDPGHLAEGVDPERACDDVSLSWVKVATRRVDAQRPARAFEDFPGREPQ